MGQDETGSMAAPAPAVETAPPGTGELDESVGGEIESAGTNETARSFSKSDVIEHQFRMSSGGRMNVAFRVSFSGVESDMQFAADSVRDNWSSAVEYACTVCEATDLVDEDRREAFEDLMCRQLTQILFPQEAGQGRVERVIWDRLIWQ